MRARALVLLAATAWLGCDDEDEGTDAVATTPPAAEAPAPPAPTSAAPKAPTGLLSEDDFAELHELTGEAAPPPEGETVALGEGEAYLSLPEGEPPFPGLVVIHEWWGLNEHIRHWSDRLAEDGYATVAVDLYEGETAEEPKEAMRLMKAVEADAARKTLLSGFRFLKRDERVKAPRRGSIGWCFGGKWSLELALAAPELDAAVVYYGHVETDPARLAKLEAPLLAIFGTEDEAIPPKMVDRFEFGLEQAGRKRYRILRYEAPHAFANPSSARYDSESASAAWEKVRAFLAQHLKEPASEE